MMKRKIQVHNIHNVIHIQKRPIQKFVRSVLEHEKIDEAEISIVFVDHNYITNLNREFLNSDKTTDVISFPLGDETDPSGEVYINIDQVAGQATEFGVTFFQELYRIVVHGILHLLGYDDLESTDKSIMTRREDYYLDQIYYEEEN